MADYQRRHQAAEAKGEEFDQYARILREGRPSLSVVFGAADIEDEVPPTVAIAMIDAEDQRVAIDYLDVDSLVHTVAALVVVGRQMFDPDELTVKLYQHLIYGGVDMGLGTIPEADGEAS